MFPSFPSILRSLRPCVFLVVARVILVSCKPGAQTPASPTSEYDRAKDAFKSGQLEQALDLTDKLATATTPDDATDRARVLRAVIYTGELKGAMELATAYGQGAEKAKNPRFKSEYLRLQSNNFQVASAAALNLAETAHQLAPDGVIAKELILEASYPTTEGPVEIPQLARVKEGGWIEPDQQDSASTDALRKGVDEALADVVSGDRAKARDALAGGSLKLDGGAFAIFLSQELADGAVVFDRHHSRDPQKLVAMCGEGEQCSQAALAFLKDAPNKEQLSAAKKLQDKFKTIRKDK